VSGAVCLIVTLPMAGCYYIVAQDDAACITPKTRPEEKEINRLATEALSSSTTPFRSSLSNHRFIMVQLRVENANLVSITNY